ncbi:hypothetical protein ABEH22_22700 [Pantoea agglomerans]|uniref:hypothetical protein n=1 Tax=Enterobacter agglomerans TaxID=549 RepID=UPI0032089E2C
MTTIFAHSELFAVADELWTDNNDLPAPPPFFKYYVTESSVLFYSGNVMPILATLSGYVGALKIDEEYVERMFELSEMEQVDCEFLEVDRFTGEVVFSESATEIEFADHRFFGIGSGSDHALRKYSDMLSVMHDAEVQFDFDSHGFKLIESSMLYAFREDNCSGGGICHAFVEGSSMNLDGLKWPSAHELPSYHARILSKIDEVFESKEEIIKLIAMMQDEVVSDTIELENETKAFDQSEKQAYNHPILVSAKGRNAMSNTTNTPARVATKTSGSGRGKPFNAAGIKARIAQRKAEGLN